MLELFALWVVARIRRDDAERGDVPGWVMVTIMTAGLVVAIGGLFWDQISDAVSDAIDSVVGANDDRN